MHRAGLEPGKRDDDPATVLLIEGEIVTVYWDDNADWANEFHPNLNGFRKLVRRFSKTLLKHLA